MKISPLLVFLGLAFAAQWVTAEAPLTGIYQARVPIDDRSTATRQAAIRQGLAQVLVKVSGFSGTPDFEGLETELASAERYLLEFSIESISEPAADGVGAENGEALWVRFNQELVDELVRRWEVPVWPSSRPEIGLTMQVVMGGENILLGESNYPAAAALLKQNASRRGVHLKLLTAREGGDLLVGNQNTSTAYDYWGLVAMEQDRFGDRQVRLNIQSSGEPTQTYESAASNLADAIAEAFDQFVDQVSLNASFIAAVASGNQVTLELSGINDYAAYRRTLDSLENLEMVDEARVLQLDLDQVQVRVKIASNLSLLLDAIRQQGILDIEQENTTQSSGYPTIQLRYRAGN